MNAKIVWMLFLGALLFAPACKQQEKSGEGMSGFAGDKKFQNAHQTPKAMAFSPKGTMIRFSTPDAKEGHAYAMLTRKTSKKYMIIIHEWWGLNDYIKQEVERWFDQLDQKVNVIAVDMYDGKVASNAEEASRLMQGVTKTRGEAILAGVLGYAGPKAELASLGWCFGGGWALQVGILGHHYVKGVVMYYGLPVQNASELAPLKAPILGIFGKRDKWITPKIVEDFENLTKATGRSLTVHMFNADHAFANPSNPNFDRSAAEKAHELALDFIRNSLLPQE